MTATAHAFGPARETRPCSACGTPVDPLRAERVAYVRERFRYFCSVACRERFDLDPHLTPLPLPRSRSERPGGLRTPLPTPLPTPSPERSIATARALADVARPESAGAELERLPRAAQRSSRPPEPAAADALTERGAGASGLLLTLAGLGSALSLGLALAGASRTVLAARVVLAAVACAALVTERATGPRDRSELHPAAFSAAPIAAAGVAWGTLLLGDPRTAEAITLTSLVVALGALSAALLRWVRRPSSAARERIQLALSGNCRRVVEDGTVAALALDLRPGEEILVEAGDIVPADASVTAGEGVIFPWLDAKVAAPVREGDTVLAGARLAEGRIRAIVGWSGDDRAYARLTSDPRRRADLLAPVARAGRLFAERGALLVTGLAALTAFAAGLDGVEILLVAVAVQAACAHPVTAAVAALRVADTVLGGLRRGVVWKSAESLDQAGHTSVAVFCARGTLLLGEPEVATIEAFGANTPEEVLSLVAGAESGEHHPVASAVVRAARARGIRPDSVRSPRAQAGLGITAIASNGQPLVVGSRALLLYEHVSVAIAERRIQELESMGQTVLLLAVAERLVGLVGLQDGLRPGARAAVQHLLDAGLEPALLSSDARETCEALGRALAIDHVRPEVPPAERGEEIKRLVGGGATVAVIGQSPGDDAALAAADIAVALKSAGSTAADFSIHLATDDVRDAAFALYTAKQCLRRARIDLALCGLPALGLTAIAALGMLPPAWVPTLSTAGALLALRRAATIG
jgi:P-type E1-E2 ATPase